VSTPVPNPVELSSRDFRRSRRDSRRGRRRRRRHHRRWPKRLGIALLIAVPVLGAIAALSFSPAVAARRSMISGRSQLAEARALLLKGDVAQAKEKFHSAAEDFSDAVDSAANPFIRVESFFPFFGRTPDALRALANIGATISDAGSSVSGAVAALPGGLDALAPTRGQIPLDAMQQLQPVVAHARAELETARSEADGVSRSFVLQPVVEAGDLVRTELDRVLPAVRAADGLLRVLPQFAGGNGRSEYFLAAENPTEARGTGGLISSYAILTIDHGRISISAFHDIHELPNIAPDKATWPSEEFRAIYGPFNAAGFWRNANMTPDAPTAGGLIENLWHQQTGKRLDGTVFVDIQTLSYLVDALGSVQVPQLHVTLTKRNTVPYVANQAYSDVNDDTTRKKLLGIVGQEVFGEFLAEASGDGALRALISAGADGHILLYGADAQTQAAFAEAGLAGTFGTTQGDFFAPVVNNIGGNKVDYYLHRSISYDIALQPGGGASATANVAFANDAPANAKPSYALGPYQGSALGDLHLKPGEEYARTGFYCGSGCVLDKATSDGQPMIVEPYTEKDLSLYASYLRVLPQQTKHVSLGLDLATAWQGSDAVGSYTLRLQDQPTVQPTKASVTIHVPSGMHISFASAPLQVRDDTATWTGEVGDATTVEVRFERNLPGRIWSDISDFLSKPVIKL
jgi:uncharacterized protein DUF4012